MAPKSSMILFMTVRYLCTAHHPEEWTIPVVSDEYGILSFGNPFEQNDTTQEQSLIDEHQLMDKALGVELSPVQIFQSQAIRTLLTDEDMESLSADPSQSMYTFMRRAEVYPQNIADTEVHQQKVPSTLSQLETRTIPAVNDEHGNLFFGYKFKQNEAMQVQSLIDEPLLMEEVPLSVDFSRELHAELPPVHVSESQAIKALLTDEDMESLSAELYQPVYALLHSAEVHENIADPEAHKREVSSTLPQESMTTDTSTGLIDTDLGSLLAFGDLGPLSVDCIDVEPLSVDPEMEMLSDNVSQDSNALMDCSKHQLNKSATKTSDFPKHRILKQTGQKSFQCDICSKQFCTFYNYQRHRQIHSGEKPFQCDICSKQFSDASNCRRHRQIHTGEKGKPFQCDVCSKQFRSSSDCKKHQRIHTGEKPFKCDFCQKKFSDPSSYQSHRRIHTSEKPFRCGICPKQFRKSSDCQKHRRIHTGEKPFKCDSCQKEFSDSSSYQRHRRIHTGEKPFQCDICPTQFLTSGDYQKHRLIHTGEKPFQCDLCPKQFRTSSQYWKHRRVHADEKPFQCDKCPKQFRTPSQRRRTHAADKSYICHWCNQDYCSKRNLIKHVRKCSSKNASCTTNPAVSCSISSDKRKWTYMQ